MAPMRDDEEEDKPFEVKDRRRFDSDGDSVEAEPGPAEEGEAQGEAGKPEASLPPMDFSTLVLSLASSVVAHMGEMPRPDTGKTEKNLPLAKQTIDLLGVLQEKTRGNLTKEESDLLESLLYELRLKYVQAVR